MSFRQVISILSLGMFLALLGCSGKSEKIADKPETAIAVMQPTTGNEASGTVTFTKVADGIQVVAHFEGVPEGEHGFHIHAVGDCSSGDGKSAGGHFNPEGYDHAGPDAAMRHVGDLGNITADTNGVAHAEFTDSHLTFEGDKSILGKGVILHADRDDLTSQPTGAAGARISCGVIEKQEETKVTEK
ncbi:MAG: superoxide dismutase family protein [bacterium]